MKQELSNLKLLKEKIIFSLQSAPSGRLKCKIRKGKAPQYYRLLPEEKKKYPNGKYLRKADLDIARQLAQKEYNLAVLAYLENHEKSIQRFLKSYRDINLTSIYDNLHPGKKALVTPIVLSDEDFLANWDSQFVCEMNTYPIHNGFPTEKGEIVRSKSEKMIADKLFYRNIPYKYEAQLALDARTILYPDFTILNKRTRKTYYLEHLGLMDNPDYCKKALEKIDTYEAYGYYQNDSLLITMESSLKGINLRQVDMMIDRYLT